MRGGRLLPALCIPLAFFLFAGCRKKTHASALPLPLRAAVGATEEGIASWYGHPYHGRATSSGEIYDMERMTAAHRTLPFGTRIRVENLSNGRHVEVTINDRGPFVEARLIDLSHAAARRLELLGPGTARVRLRIISLPDNPVAGFYAVQVGAFANSRNAERLRARLAREYGSAFIQKHNAPQGLFYRVLVGQENGVLGAEHLAERLRKHDLTPFVVRIDESARRNRL